MMFSRNKLAVYMERSMRAMGAKGTEERAWRRTPKCARKVKSLLERKDMTSNFGVDGVRFPGESWLHGKMNSLPVSLDIDAT